MKPFRLLVIGGGSAGRSVAAAAKADGRGQAVAFAEPRKEQWERIHKQFPEAEIGEDYQAQLKRHKPDAVVVASPDHLHAEHALAAMEQGCHVLIEKPLTTTVADARRLIAKQQETGLEAMVDQTMRYVPPWCEMSRAARGGEIGRVFYIEGSYVHDMWHYYSPQGRSYTPWRRDPSAPQNILLGGGCHPIDLILSTIPSEVAEVFAFSNKLSIPEFPADDCYIVTFRFEDRTLGKVMVTCGCSGHGMGEGFLAVYGTEGTLWQGKKIRRGAEPEAIKPTEKDTIVGGHGWGGSVRDFLSLLSGQIQNPIPLQQGARTVALCEAALRSIQTHQPQRPESF
jgi:predicted dehydrogenase